MNSNEMECNCSSLYSEYYAVVYDQTRLEEGVSITEPELIYWFIEFDEDILSVVILMLFLALLLPILAIYCDKIDYDSFRNDENSEVTSEDIENFAHAKSDENNVITYEKAIYSKPLLLQFVSMGTATCGGLFGLFMKNLHPLLGIAFRFDFGFKRLLRAMIFVVQMTIVTFIVTVAFGSSYRKDGDREDNNEMDSVDFTGAIVAGIALALIYLPVPEELLRSCMTQLVYVKTVKGKEH